MLRCTWPLIALPSLFYFEWRDKANLPFRMPVQGLPFQLCHDAFCFQFACGSFWFLVSLRNGISGLFWWFSVFGGFFLQYVWQWLSKILFKEITMNSKLQHSNNFQLFERMFMRICRQQTIALVSSLDWYCRDYNRINGIKYRAFSSNKIKISWICCHNLLIWCAVAFSKKYLLSAGLD